MQRRTTRRPASGRCLSITVALLLAGCAATPVSQEFRLAYGSARGALETGDYPAAIRLYEDLLAGSRDDATGIAVRLDYAHALLRAGEPDRALQAARRIAALSPGSSAAGNAKLVAAVAEHEISERALARGAPYEEAQAQAQAALRSLRLVSRGRPNYDSGGVLTDRMRRLRERLAELEIAQLHADLESDSAAAAADRAAYILREFADTAAAADAQALLRRSKELGNPGTKDGNGEPPS